ncbi:Imm1 family immunity protein [Phytohabitans maris]|nr:Imm1 family immunity protein [Phytohabitans sp. ZYX-F-186]
MSVQFLATWADGHRYGLDRAEDVVPLLVSIHECHKPVVVTLEARVDVRGLRVTRGLHLGVGHEKRGFAFPYGRPHTGYAVHRGVRPWHRDISFGFEGTPTPFHPAETRITPEQVWALALSYLATGHTTEAVGWGCLPTRRKR